MSMNDAIERLNIADDAKYCTVSIPLYIQAVRVFLRTSALLGVYVLARQLAIDCAVSVFAILHTHHDVIPIRRQLLISKLTRRPC